ncbi:MAG: polyprenyl synthetase family protein [Oscillospiraceae bacterium]
MRDKYQERLAAYTARINRTLADFTVRHGEAHERVLEAMEHSLRAGGKRIRPILALEFCRLCGGDWESVLPAACAVELVHTFSLVHDDLPCMDDDDFRRGQPACHKAFGEACALLAGDALSVLPFEAIADAGLTGKIPLAAALESIRTLAAAVGTNGMIGGQILDMEAEHRALSAVELENLQAKKTGALIEAACEIGCLLAGARDKLPAARAYAQKLGLAFQITDDILDVTGDFQALGKPIGSDESREKTTFVSLFGLAEARARAAQLTEEALALLDGFPDSDFLKTLTKQLLTRQN